MESAVTLPLLVQHEWLLGRERRSVKACGTDENLKNILPEETMSV